MKGDGFDEAEWASIKDEVKQVLLELARRHETATYSELVDRLERTELSPRSPRLTQLLEKISREENAEGRGMLSALVVRSQEGIPGAGFFELAKELDRTVGDQRQFWENEVQRVWEAWNQDE